MSPGIQQWAKTLEFNSSTNQAIFIGKNFAFLVAQPSSVKISLHGRALILV